MPSLLRRSRGSLGLLSLGLGVSVIVGAQAPNLDSTPVDQATAKIVAALVEQGHISKPRINDDVSKAWCRNFLKVLDPLKLYFYKSDVDGFLKNDTSLDDWVRRGDLEFAKQVFRVFLKRHDERLAVVNELLKEKPDYTVDESIVDDPEKYDYAKTPEEARDMWRKRVKLELLIFKVDKTEDAEAVRLLTVRYRDRNRQWHQLDMSELLEIYLTSLTTAIDPHTSYLSARNWDDMLNQQLHLSLEGIGARLSSEDGMAVIEEVVPGGAADKDGRIQPKDKVLGVIKEDGKELSFIEMKLTDVVSHIRGARGTKVKLIVRPANTLDRKIYELTREKIELKDEHAQAQVVPLKTAEGRELKLGVITLPAFYGDTAAVLNGDPNAVSATLDCRKHLAEFKKQGVNAVIMDLRGNGGGLLQESITLSGLFIDKGPVVQVREANGVKNLDDDDEGTEWDGPLAVIIDKTSASASEIFAGVIQDYGRGLVIGDSSTFGKGTVQTIIPISEQLNRRDVPNLGALKMTIQQFYRADGASTQIQGVRPDIHIPSRRDQADFGEGKMDNALKFDSVPALAHDRYNRVPKDLIERLQARSDARRKDNAKFKKEDDAIRKMIERKKNSAISLNEKVFRDEYVSPESEDEKAKDGEQAKTKARRRKAGDNQPWNADFYTEEIVSILTDYLTLGSKVLASVPARADR